MHNGKARAFTNIALIKYWGKKDPQLILPMNNSLSLTLDAFYTETSVSFSKEYTADSFYLDGQLQDEKSTEKVRRFLDLVREQSQIFEYAIVQSQNFVPTAAGLASSASGLAALAGACNDALGLNLSDKELSRLARKGLALLAEASMADLSNGKKEILTKTPTLFLYRLTIGKMNWR